MNPCQILFPSQSTKHIDATIAYGEGDKGWVGDVPRFSYSIEKLRKLGWRPKLGSAQAVQLAIEQIAADLSRT